MMCELYLHKGTLRKRLNKSEKSKIREYYNNQNKNQVSFFRGEE